MENYGSYGEIEGCIEKALSVMQDDLELTCAEAARQFFVPYPRPYARLKRRNSKTIRPRTNLRLIEEQNQALQEYVHRCDALNSPALIPQLLDAAERILKQSEPEAAPLGKNWITRFLR
jgi:Tc5 transposase DNA-binding domain